MKKLFVLFLLPAFFTYSQIPISVGNGATENFNGLGTSATATMPANWKVDKNTSIRFVGNYSSADNTTNRIGGNNLSTSAGNGIYNFGLGDASTASDRAIGGLSSGSGSNSVNVYSYFQNNGTETIRQVDISYDVFRFRDGLNAAGFSFQLYYSTDGQNWTSAGSAFLNSFSPNADNNGGTVPMETQKVLNQTLQGLNIPQNGGLYLAWNYSVTTGTSTTSSQALGIDNFVMNNILSTIVTIAPAAPIALQASNITDISFTANWNSTASASDYLIDVSTTQDFSGIISSYSNKSLGNVTSVVVTPLQSNTQYYFRLRASNQIGASPNSNIISVKTLETATTIQFTGIADAVIKSAGVYNLVLTITNPDPSNATNCSVAFISDSSTATTSYLNNFSTANVTFAAGDTSRANIQLSISDNGIAEIPKKAYFLIQNVTGGTSAQPGDIKSFILSITSGIDTAYYSSIPKNISGDSLKNDLNTLISSNVIEYPYTDNSSSTSIDVWKMLKAADEDPKNPDNVIAIYSGLSIPKDPTNIWNREHVWSKSHGDFGTATGAGTDAHHLRPENPTVNSLKSNLDFDNGGNPVPNAPGCFYDSDSWEPRDAVKGDIARMIFYMATRYQGKTVNSITDPNLVIVDYIPSSSSNQPYYGKLSTLLKWNQQDPPDAFEMNRNNVVYYYQHNRNPYIDHPEWVALIWGTPTGVDKDNSAKIITSYSLYQNYPNPFNPSTNISYDLPRNSHVNIVVFDLLGRIVRTLVDQDQSAGRYQYKFSSENISSGIYFYRIIANDFVQTKKLMILK